MPFRTYNLRHVLIVLLGLFLVIAGSTSCKSPESEEPQNEQQATEEIIGLMRTITSSIRRKDYGGIESSFAEEFLLTFPDGSTMTKTKLFAGLRADQITLKSIEFTDLDFRYFKNFALLNGTVDVDIELDGIKTEGRFRGGITFIRKEKKWFVLDEYVGIPVKQNE